LFVLRFGAVDLGTRRHSLEGRWQRASLSLLPEVWPSSLAHNFQAAGGRLIGPDLVIDFGMRISETNNMNQIFLNSSVTIAILFCTASLFAANQSADETAIRALETGQQEAWNHHDAKAYANLFTENGDCVNVVGWWWKGRAEIEKKLTDAYVYVFKESTLTITGVDIRFLTPEFAVAHVRWTMTGARTPTGLPVPQQGIQTHLLQKTGGQWLIAAFQNTNLLPEMPFPKGPVGSQSPPAP
jgi:uncharacterized protein (TIGR02246 family)